jgi:hypothetical protein
VVADFVAAVDVWEIEVVEQEMMVIRDVDLNDAHLGVVVEQDEVEEIKKGTITYIYQMMYWKLLAQDIKP